MALVAYIADTHFGANNSNNLFLKYHDRYFEKLVIDLEAIGITDLFHLGDLYDVRKSVNFKTLRESAHFFRERMMAAKFNFHIIVGNHDSYHKSSLKINAPNELLNWTDFKIYQEPTEISVNDTKFLIVPWICNDNAELSMDMIENSMADICLGHFDISGFGMSKEVINKAGLSRSMFRKFSKTFSGHFHLPSDQDNITYVGSPYQLTWSDYSDIKRVIIHDTVTGALSYIENHNTIFEKIFYTEGYELDQVYTDKIVKLYTDTAWHDSYKFDKFVQRLQEQNPYSISIINTVSYDEDSSCDANMTKDTMEFLVDHIDNLSEEHDQYKSDVKSLLFGLYNKAQELA